jgi:copper oxidase (laccase) domain-containing protein
MTDLTVAISTVADGSLYNRHNKDDVAIIKNRELFLAKKGITLNQTTRVQVSYDEDDFCRYFEVGKKLQGDGMHDNGTLPADALITTQKNHALFLPVADCVGTVLYDPTHAVLMLSHLGRHSLVQQGGRRSVEYLVKHYGSHPKDILVWTTPAPNKETFPIWDLDNKGFKEALFEQLAEAGILQENITDNPADSTTDPNYYSYSEFLKGNREEDGDHAIIAMMR